MNGRSTGTVRNGFTLIELLVVIGIIAILASISLVVASGVLGDAKARATRETIRVLDTMLEEYTHDRGQRVPAYVTNPDPDDGAPANVLPIADAVFDIGFDPETPGRGRLLNSGGLALEALREASGVEDQLAALDPSLIELRPTFSPTNGGGDGADDENENDPGVQTVLDAWGNPIRFVHPRWDGVLVGGNGRAKNTAGQPINDAQALFTDLRHPFMTGSEKLRRNKVTSVEYAENGGGVALDERDADGGQCDGDRPYFYSAGEAGDPSDVDANVYTVKPKFITPMF